MPLDSLELLQFSEAFFVDNFSHMYVSELGCGAISELA